MYISDLAEFMLTTKATKNVVNMNNNLVSSSNNIKKIIGATIIISTACIVAYAVYKNKGERI